MPRFEPQPNPDGFCDDPTHRDGCTCGARPDYEYERCVEGRR